MSVSLAVEKLIILKNHKHGESDLVIHGLSSKGSKLHLFARSALKSRKRFGGGLLEPTQYIKASLRLKSEGLHEIVDAVSIYSFENLRKDYDRLSMALQFVQWVDRCSFEGLQDSAGVFDLLGNSLRAIETSVHLENLNLQFLAKLLFTQGVLTESLQNSDLLRVPISDHQSLQISKDSFKNFQREIQKGLDYIF